MAFPRRLSHFVRLELDPFDLFEANELTRRLLFRFPALMDPVGDLGPWLHPFSVVLCTEADARFRGRGSSVRQSFVDYVVAMITETRMARNPEVVLADAVSAQLHTAMRRMTKQLAESRVSIERLRVEDDSEHVTGGASSDDATGSSDGGKGD